MPEISGLLCILLVALGVITLIGHAIWIVVAQVARAIFGSAPAAGGPLNAADDELRDIAATQRQLQRLVEHGALDPATCEQLSSGLNQRRRELVAGEPRIAELQQPVKRQPPIPVVQAEAILDALPIVTSTPVPATPTLPRVEPVVLPTRPRRTLSEVLAGFMEEHNILWGELTGGLLIVGCSVALVIYLWQTQQEIRYFPFFVVAGVTAALFGAGMFALRRWRLETTSRGLLIIATLLVPLSFLVLAGLSRGEEGGWFEIALEIIALGVFGWLVSRAGGVLSGPEQMPGRIDARWLLTTVVLLASGAQLLVPRLISASAPILLSFMLLGLVTTACHNSTMAVVLSRARGRLSAMQAHALFAFLGMATFPLAVALGFLVYWCDDPALALERVAVLIAVAGVPVLATGVIVHSSPVPVPVPEVEIESGTGTGTGEVALSAPLRTVGTGIALAGMLVLLAAVALAWPQPVALILVCAVDFTVLSIVAWRCQLPVAHAAALPCLAVGYLTAYHLLTGGLDVARAELGPRLIDMALTPTSGAALAVLAVLLAATAEVMVRLSRQLDGIHHAVGAGIVGLLSLALVTQDGVDNPERAAVVWGALALTGLLANGRWWQSWLTYAAAGIVLGAMVYALRDIAPEMTAARLWLLALLLHATVALLGSITLGRTYQPGAPATKTADPSLALRAGQSFVVPSRRCALIASIFALVLLFSAVQRDWLGATAVHTLWLACVWLVLAWIMDSRSLFTAFQVLTCVAVIFGATAWLDWQSWIEKWPDDLIRFRSLQAYGIWLAALGLLWVAARLALRSNERAQHLVETARPAFDRIMIGWIVLGFVGMTIVGVAPAVFAEWTATGEASFSFTASATGPGAWAFFGALVLVLTAALWDRLPTEAVLGLLLLALSVPFLVGGAFAPDRAAASALRWGLAIVFTVCSVGFWQRDQLARLTGYVGIQIEATLKLPAALRLVLLGGTVGPVLALTAITAGLRISGETLGGPGTASFFAKIGSLTSNVVPLALVSIGLVGHGIRERSAGYLLAAGLVANLTLMGGYVLGVVTSGGAMADARWVFVLQLGTLGAAMWAALWLGSRRWIAAWREGPDNPSATPLMRFQLALSVTGNLILVLLTLGHVFMVPDRPLPLGQTQVGHVPGWLALLASAGVVFWHAALIAPQTRIHVVYCLGFGLVALAACAFNAAALPWASYHILMAAGAAYALAFLGVGVVAASVRLSGLADSQVREQTALAAWLADLVPAPAVRSWLHGIGAALVLLALRGGWTDPQRPVWSVGGVLAVSAVAAAFAVWFLDQRYVYVSGLLANLAGILLWAARGPDTFGGFLAVNVLCLAVASLFWSAIELALRRSPLRIELGGRVWPFAHAALAAGIVLLGVAVADHLGRGWAATNSRAETLLAWLALAATVAAAGILFWDARARFVCAGLYVTGLLAMALALSDIGLSPARFWWATAWGLGGYVLLASGLRAMGDSLRDGAKRLGVPARNRDWPVAWFPVAQAIAAGVVVVLSMWMVLDFELLADRIAGPLAVALLVPAGVLLAGTPDRWREIVRTVALVLGVVVVAEMGWALLNPAGPALWLHRNALLLVALALMTALYGVALPRLLHSFPEWVACARRIGPIVAVLASVQLFIVLGHEAALYNPDPAVRTTPLAWWGVLAVAAGFGLLIIAVLRFAVAPGREPFGLSESGRTLYVYAAEMLAVLLLVHLRLNVPDLFPPILGRYWPLIVMGIAFLGVGLGEWFERRGWRVLAEPLRRTGVFLPLLPLLAFWVRDLTGIRETINANVPALSPLLRYLERMEGGFGLHASVWFIVGMLYALIAVNRRSFRFALLAALAANFGLWVIFANVQGLHFIAHPQLWLIPLAVILLVAEQLNRDKLTESQAAALRYLALTVLYVSSTADMFIAGIGKSVALPVVLAVLAVLGIFAGILLRVRAFLFQGVTFLFVVVFTMIWHAAVQRGQTWVWYVSGIVLGAAILALFALFEKRRNKVVRVAEELKRWE